MATSSPLNSVDFDFDEIDDFEHFTELVSSLNVTDRCSPAYANLQKHLGVAAFNEGDFFTAAYHFQESFGPGLRTYVNILCDKKIRAESSTNPFDISPSMRALENKLLKMDPKTSKWNDGLIDFCFKNFKKAVDPIDPKFDHKNSLKDQIALKEIMAHKCLESWSVESMKNNNEKLPQEWTIVQITKGPNIKDHIGPYEANNLVPVPIYITLFSGDNIDIKDHKPITICIHPSDEPGRKFVLSEILSVIEHYCKRHIDTVQKEKYWNDLRKLEDHLKMLLTEFSDWLGGLECLFLGKLKTNSKDYKLICKEVDNCIAQFNVAEHERILLYRLAAYSASNSLRLLNQTLAQIIPGSNHKETRIVLDKFFSKIWKSNETHYKNMANAERGPVILIVDEFLDKIPWEMLQCLRKEPVCRVHSLHLLHAIHCRYNDVIEDGYCLIKQIDGEIILNAGNDLPKLEKRMTAFCDYWLKDWKNRIIGRKPTDTEYTALLRRCSIFLYAGHGGGAQYLPQESIEKLPISCVALLSGCSSTTLIKDGRTESHGLHISYNIAGSPCVLGNLWIVTDTDSDLIMARILSTWIPAPKNTKHFMECNLDKWELGVIDPNKVPSANSKRRPLIGPFYPDILEEEDLLKVLAISRGNASSIFNICAMVARGIPVKLTRNFKCGK